VVADGPQGRHRRRDLAQPGARHGRNPDRAADGAGRGARL